jgi:hypothetical protein
MKRARQIKRDVENDEGDDVRKHQGDREPETKDDGIVHAVDGRVTVTKSGRPPWPCLTRALERHLLGWVSVQDLGGLYWCVPDTVVRHLEEMRHCVIDEIACDTCAARCDRDAHLGTKLAMSTCVKLERLEVRRYAPGTQYDEREAAYVLARLVTRNRTTLRVATFPHHTQIVETLPWTLLSCPLLERLDLQHLSDTHDVRPIFFNATQQQPRVQHLSMKRDLNGKRGWRPSVRDILGCGWHLQTLELHLYMLPPPDVVALLRQFPHLRTFDCVVTFCTHQPPPPPPPPPLSPVSVPIRQSSKLLSQTSAHTSSSSSSASASFGAAPHNIPRHTQLRHLLAWLSASPLECLTLRVAYVPSTQEADAQLKLEDGRAPDAPLFIWRSATLKKLTIIVDNPAVHVWWSDPCPFARVTLQMPRLDDLGTKFVDLRCALSVLSADSTRALRALSVSYSDVHAPRQVTQGAPTDSAAQTLDRHRRQEWIEAALGHESAAHLQVFTIELYHEHAEALSMEVVARVLVRHPRLTEVELPVDQLCAATLSAQTRDILRHCPLLKTVVLNAGAIRLDHEQDVHVTPDVYDTEDTALVVAQHLEVLRLPETSRALWHNLRLPRLRTLPEPTCADLGAMWRACSSSEQLYAGGTLTITCHPVRCVRRREYERAFDVHAIDLGTDAADAHFEWLDALLSWVPDLQRLHVRCSASDCVIVLETVEKAALAHLHRVTVEVMDALRKTHAEKIIACGPAYRLQLTLETFDPIPPPLLHHPRIRAVHVKPND